MISATAFGLRGPTQAFEKMTVERRELGPNDVLIDIAYAGICHSDIHTAREEWGPARFPLVPGHEITGTVTAVGDAVSRHRVDDRVGVGVIVDSCRRCANCLAGNEQYCAEGATDTYGGVGRDGLVTYGGYSSNIVVDEHFVYSLPTGLDLAATAPLLCAGTTLWWPLQHWGAGPGRRLAIVGLGGLGHVGVKLAHAMGAEVTVLSQSEAKRADAERLGADDFRVTTDDATFDELDGSLDLIISTVSVPLPLDRYLSLLRTDGVLSYVGLPPEPLELRAASLVDGRRIVAGSGISGVAETQEMLDFCGEHDVTADIEMIGATDIDTAWDRVVGSDVRYRFVIDTTTF